MESPSPVGASSGVRVRVDRQGRMVIPVALRDQIATTPGDLVIHLTPDGLLLTAAPREGAVSLALDGLPVLELDRAVLNPDVLAAIDHERSSP